MSKSFNGACDLVFADLANSLCVLDVAINDNALHPIGVYAANDPSEQPDLLWWIKLCLISCHLVLAGNWNSILDPKIVCIEPNLGTNKQDMRPFWDFIDKFHLVDKYHIEYHWEIMWTWINKGSSVTEVHSSYLN